MSNDQQKLDRESIAAARNANRGEPSLDVVKWLHTTPHGVLGTLNTESAAEGYPTGSVVPFSVDGLGRLIIFIADIALHTRNLINDPRASLFIHNGQAVGDPQASWRASINGKFVRLSTASTPPAGSESISNTEFAQLMARYVLRVPNAKSYAGTHDFHFWRMNEVDSIRYIAGFGRICTFAGQDYLDQMAAERYAAVRAGALKHMNEDHTENMREICRAMHGVDPQHVEMAALERTGCLFSTREPEGFFFSPFANVVTEPGAFKSEIIALLHSARAQNNP